MPDLILLDVALRGMSGLEVLVEVRKQHSLLRPGRGRRVRRMTMRMDVDVDSHTCAHEHSRAPCATQISPIEPVLSAGGPSVDGSLPCACPAWPGLSARLTVRPTAFGPCSQAAQQALQGAPARHGKRHPPDWRKSRARAPLTP